MWQRESQHSGVRTERELQKPRRIKAAEPGGKGWPDGSDVLGLTPMLQVTATEPLRSDFLNLSDPHFYEMEINSKQEPTGSLGGLNEWTCAHCSAQREAQSRYLTNVRNCHYVGRPECQPSPHPHELCEPGQTICPLWVAKPGDWHLLILLLERWSKTASNASGNKGKCLFRTLLS